MSQIDPARLEWHVRPNAQNIGFLIEVQVGFMPIVIRHDSFDASNDIIRIVPGLEGDPDTELTLAEVDYIDICLFLSEPEGENEPYIDAVLTRQKKVEAVRNEDGTLSNQTRSIDRRKGKMMHAYREWWPSREHRVTTLVNSGWGLARAQERAAMKDKD